MSRPRIRVLAGPTIHDLEEIKANSGNGHKISTDAFEGEVAVFFRGFSNADGSEGDNAYFRSRKRKTCSIQFQGKPVFAGSEVSYYTALQAGSFNNILQTTFLLERSSIGL